MPKLIDPDDLSISVNGTPTTEEIAVLTGPKTIELRVAGNLDDTSPGKTSGVIAKAVYSFLKEEYLSGTDSATLRRFRFPFKMIFEGSFIWANGWSPANDQTRDLFRDAGFQESVSSNINACLVSLGDVHADADQSYYTQAQGFTETIINYDKTGELNENIDITGSTTYQKTFLRIQAKTYAEYNLLTELGISAISFQAYSFPLSNSSDSKINESDANIDANPPYTGMKVNYLRGIGFETWSTGATPALSVVQDSGGRWWFTLAGGTSAGDDTDLGGGSDTGVTWEAYDGEELIGSTYYAFNRVVTGNNGTDQQIYNFDQRQLRKTTDINADDTTSPNQQGFGTVNGEVAALLNEYVGDTLKPKPGVLLRGFNTNSTNNITHSPIDVDSGGLDADAVPTSWTEVSFPFVAAGNFNFSANLDAETDNETYYTVYFEYITLNNGSYTLTLDATDTGDLTWAGTDLDDIIVGDYIKLDGFVTNPLVNDGLYEVLSTGANTMSIQHQEGFTLVTETATIDVYENPFESPGAVIVEDNSSIDMSGEITAAQIAWDFDYTNNNQGGRTPNTNAFIHIVASALDGAEWTEATHEITASTGQAVSINASDERNYSNP